MNVLAPWRKGFPKHLAGVLESERNVGGFAHGLRWSGVWSRGKTSINA